MKIQRLKMKSPSIMLTPMLDMFTMILIFLIVSYAPDQAQLQKSASITLPESKSILSSIPKIQIEVTKDSIRVNGSEMKGLSPLSADAALWAEFKNHLDQLSKRDVTGKTQNVLLLADKSANYGIVDRTVAHLAAAGYGSISFLTNEKEDLK